MLLLAHRIGGAVILHAKRIPLMRLFNQTCPWPLVGSKWMPEHISGNQHALREFRKIFASTFLSWLGNIIDQDAPINKPAGKIRPPLLVAGHKQRQCFVGNRHTAYAHQPFITVGYRLFANLSGLFFSHDHVIIPADSNT